MSIYRIWTYKIYYYLIIFAKNISNYLQFQKNDFSGPHWKIKNILKSSKKGSNKLFSPLVRTWNSIFDCCFWQYQWLYRHFIIYDFAFYVSFAQYQTSLFLLFTFLLLHFAIMRLGCVCSFVKLIALLLWIQYVFILL